MTQKYMVYTEDLKQLCDITTMTSDELWDAGICLDDWDYAIIVSGKIPQYNSRFDSDGYGLLRGCSHNKWKYLSKINMTIGMAYHS